MPHLADENIELASESLLPGLPIAQNANIIASALLKRLTVRFIRHPAIIARDDTFLGATGSTELSKPTAQLEVLPIGQKLTRQISGLAVFEWLAAPAAIADVVRRFGKSSRTHSWMLRGPDDKTLPI